MRGLQVSGAALLLASSIILLIPSLYTGLSTVTVGKPWVQIILGIVGAIVALALFAEKDQRTP